VLNHWRGTVPPGGNHLNQRVNTKISSVPIQKVGREYVVSDAITDPLSRVEPRLRAAKIPMRIPTTIDMILEVPSRSSVFANLPDCTMSETTGAPVWYENPKLKVSIATT